jgi:hypothetical protein
MVTTNGNVMEMLSFVTQTRTKLEREKTKLELKKEELKKSEESLVILRANYMHSLKARTVAQAVAEQTQEKIEYHISTIVSNALASVFPDPYKFILRFVSRRNKIEADLLFSKEENEVDPMDSSGGGAIDVASFALRIALWSIKKTRACILFDEPFKFLSRDLQAKASAMIKKLSEKLHLQFIIVSHIPEIIDSADKTFEIN